MINDITSDAEEGGHEEHGLAMQHTPRPSTQLGNVDVVGRVAHHRQLPRHL
jgi:hypothetical protein